MMSRRIKSFLGVFVAMVALGIFWPDGMKAAVSPSPCDGNLCTGTVIVGGQTVRYTYTEHVNNNGKLRIRVNGGTYNTSGMISYLLSGLPVFSGWDKYPNPDNGAVILPEEDVNPGRTAYELRSSTGLSSEIVDMVMEVDFSGLASGSYAFNLMVIQNGDSGAKTNIRFYVDSAAPTNDDESNVWMTSPGMDFPCADGNDNDLDYDTDCVDTNCDGEVGDPPPWILCELPELSCNDSFDNDGDGLIDCEDPDCDGRVGEFAGTGRCQYPNEFGATSCGDSFDNDGDGLIDCVDNSGGVGNRCWKEDTYGCPSVEDCSTALDDDIDISYGSGWDDLPSTGVNCFDYDCHGDVGCPASEEKRADGTPSDDQCFDGLDNDLDGTIDCADADCLGAINPLDTSERCYDDEFNLGQRYQLCTNGFDDDGNAVSDCDDTSCRRKFGDCGPCPSREDLTFDSCADGADNDSDGLSDCEDPDCGGRIMTVINAAFCAGSETGDMCGDLSDNDGDGLTDCEDPACIGQSGHDGQTCESPEATCNDYFDNDNDDLRDCVDNDCYGIGSCASKDYFDSPCRVVPVWSGPTPFVSNDPTVFADAMLTSHAGSPYQIIFTGSAVYDSVTIIIGDNTDSAAYFPYSDVGPGCELTDNATGLPTTRFGFLAVTGHALMIYSTSGPSIDTFDITLTCDTPPLPALPWDYPASISVLRRDGVIPEYGDIILTTELLESVAPVINEIEPEAGDEPLPPANGRLDVPVSLVTVPQGRRFRALPEDPAPDSGICSCSLEVNGFAMTTSSECISPQVTFNQDHTADVRARAEDGSGNVGDWSALYYFDVNVTPAVDNDLELVSPTKPFFRTLLGQNQVFVNTDFWTGVGETFNGQCEVYIRDLSGNVVGGPPGPTATFVGLSAPGTPYIRCQGTVTLSTDTMSDGTYFISVKVTDDDVDGPGGIDRADSAETSRHVMYVCNTVPGPGDADPGNGCIWADFDRDGAAEGLFDNGLYTTDIKACDNCIGLPNSSQTDANANGFGDACEPDKTDGLGVPYGRCEVDRDFVCQCDSDASCAYPCPGPSIKDDPISGSPVDPQTCRNPWGICSIDGTVCFTDDECLGGVGVGGAGFCADGATSCRREQDCIDANIMPPAFSTSACEGADRCESLLYPWMQTLYGNMFSRKKIISPEPPPDNQFNATFCITARDTILNFTSEGGCTEVDIASRYTFPKSENQYTTVLGTIDLNGLRDGKYGEVIKIPGNKLEKTLQDYGGNLDGKVVVANGDATIDSHIFNNAWAGGDGSGTIFIDGGNLTITGNVLYDSTPAETIRSLSSIGWIIIDDGSDTKGNLYIDKSVTSLAGAFFVGGKDGVWSIAPPETEGENQLVVYGLMIGRQFHFSRDFRSLTEGSERVIFDGRAIANPPPGFEDLGKRLPKFTDSAP